ncbi:sigma-70 family RNA polymerase sigma factor [Aquimarina gracilis]|uniref:Sigma-70 family RNA polymerase sigma factor n=1 Tax=Aquimarina gracilis TaxID=874422 RepID=A0ABU5ZWM5_9FLAO|nr:sigma-70 family RNA polymerase sigma factor [Aquimarina gracilis]MEB3346285.1 sigma-70 family RNA polymerase sigma factor [Aquimarina gracilis]
MRDDLELIIRLQNKESKALSAIYDRYSGALYGVILRICKNEELAQDLLQETFLKIWEKSNQYNPEKGKFFTWAYRIAKNITLNTLRKPSKLIQNEDLGVYIDKEANEPKQNLLQLDGSLKKLEPHHQKALELVYFNGLTHREAHEEMDVPLGTFKSYIRQALKKLRETYQKELFLFWIIIEKMI